MKPTFKELKSGIIISLLFFSGAGINQINTAFRPEKSGSNIDTTYTWKEYYFLYRDVYIERQFIKDSINGSELNLEISFKNQKFWNRQANENGEVRLNLLDSYYQNIPHLFGWYYLVLSALWGLVFYFSFQLILTFEKQNMFNIKNSGLIKKTGKVLILIGMIKFFGIGGLNMILSFWKGVQTDSAYDYDFFLEFILLMLIGRILMVISTSFEKGHTLEKEQELTI